MKLGGIRCDDLVQGDVRGVAFYATVEGVEGRELVVAPLSRNVTFRRLTARQVIAHWRKAAGSHPRSVRS